MDPIPEIKKAGINESVRRNLKTTIPALVLCSAVHRVVYTIPAPLHRLLLSRG